MMYIVLVSPLLVHNADAGRRERSKKGKGEIARNCAKKTVVIGILTQIETEMRERDRNERERQK